MVRLLPAALIAIAPPVAAKAAPPAAAALPATAPALNADVCDGKPVIMVVRGPVHDRARLARYAAAIRASGLYPILGGYYLNAPRAVAVFEGAPAANDSLLMVRFPCLAHARAFWYSRAYQEQVMPVRRDPDAGTFTVTVYPEAPLPDYMAGRVQPGGYVAVPPPSVAARVPQVANRPE